MLLVQNQQDNQRRHKNNETVDEDNFDLNIFLNIKFMGKVDIISDNKKTSSTVTNSNNNNNSNNNKNI